MDSRKPSRRSVRIVLTAFLLAAGFVLPGPKAADQGTTALVDVRAGSRADAYLLVCDGNFLFDRLEDSNPSRLVVDLPNVRNGIKNENVTFKSGLVTGISVVPAPGGTKATRAVCDVGRPCTATLRLE